MPDLYTQKLKYLDPFQQELPSWMAKIKENGIKRKVPIVDDDMGLFLKMICSIEKPETILEIGCGISYSTHWMLLGSENSKVIALDSNADRLGECKNYLNESGYFSRVELKHCLAEDYLISDSQVFDLIFQDSTKKGYLGMIDQCYQHLKVGGLLIADNIFFNNKVLGLTLGQKKKYAKGVAALEAFTKRISEHPGFECSFFPLSDGILVAKRII